MLVAWLSLALAADPLDEARAEAEAWPGDYSARAALAAEAAALGRHAEAAEAWARAEALSPGSLEAALGQVEPLLALGEVGAARAAAARAVALDPGSSLAWRLHAEALRHPTGFGGSALAAARAHPSARRALALDPDDPMSWCSLGWSRLRLGDAVAARRAFDAAGDHPCAREGLAAAGPGGQLTASAGALGLRYPEALGGGWGGGLAGHVDRVWASGAAMGVTARATRTGTPGAQTELWLSGGLYRGSRGLRAVAAGLRAPPQGPPGPGPGSASLPPRSSGAVLGLQAWGGAWATLRLDASLAAYGDGWGGAGGLRLDLPLSDALTVELGGGLGGFQEAPDLTPRAEDGLHPTARAGLTLDLDAATLGLDGQLGTSLRPVDLDLDATWNLSRAALGGAGIWGSWSRPGGPTWTLSLDTLALSADGGTEWLTTVSIGATTQKETAP